MSITIPKTETEIQREIVEKSAKRFPAVHLMRILSGMIRLPKRVVHGAPAGTPDLCGWLPGGKFFGVEVKTSEKGYRREQFEFIGKAAAAGCTIITASSWEDYERQVSEILEKKS